MTPVSGIVGSGKTTELGRLQEELRRETDILVAKSLAVEKNRVNLGTLIVALFFDLATDKDFKMPAQAEKRERALRDLIRKREKPVALFIDEAHDLHGRTLTGLKRLIEVVQDGGGMLSIVMAGHPKLKNDLRRPTMEEIGARTTVFDLTCIQDNKEDYIRWLIDTCTSKKTKRSELINDDAIDMLADKLSTPLQIVQYLTLAFEKGFHVGQTPITSEIIEAVMAIDIDELEANLVRNGYSAKSLAELLNIRQPEVKAFLRGQLPPGRSKELHEQLLASGVPV